MRNSAEGTLELPFPLPIRLRAFANLFDLMVGLNACELIGS